jgi:hypothetical protein
MTLDLALRYSVVMPEPLPDFDAGMLPKLIAYELSRDTLRRVCDDV